MHPETHPYKGHSSASRSTEAGWSRLKPGVFCAPAAPPRHPSAPPLSRPSPSGSGRRPGHGPVAAGAPQMQGASSSRLGGLRSGNGAEPPLLWAPGVRPGRAATTLGSRGRLGVGTGRGRGSSSPFRRPSSRLPRPLFPGPPVRPRAGPFTFKQSYEVAGAAAPGAQRGPGARRTPASTASPRGTPGGTHSPGEACGPYYRPPAGPDSGQVRPGTLQQPGTGRAGQGLASPRDGGDGGGSQARAPLSVSTVKSRAGWRGTPGETPLPAAAELEGSRRPALPVHFYSRFFLS